VRFTGVILKVSHIGTFYCLGYRKYKSQIQSVFFSFLFRDIKPHNFVLTPIAHVLLIDFGSAAPLLPPNVDGSQSISKQYCLVPCGTCDYISPEILLAHEDALLALEMNDDDGKDNQFPHASLRDAAEGYGVETDWWSLGAMLYEMAYGVAPFFANDIRQTYIRIMNHEVYHFTSRLLLLVSIDGMFFPFFCVQKSLRFDQKAKISHEYQHFLRRYVNICYVVSITYLILSFSFFSPRLLTNAKQRLGRRNVMEITDHPLFEGVDWRTLPTRKGYQFFSFFAGCCSSVILYRSRADWASSSSIHIYRTQDSNHEYRRSYYRQ
jgi:serine/threonine protein kinase